MKGMNRAFIMNGGIKDNRADRATGSSVNVELEMIVRRAQPVMAVPSGGLNEFDNFRLFDTNRRQASPPLARAVREIESP